MIEELLSRIADFHRSRPVVPEYPMVAAVLEALDSALVPSERPAAQPLPVLRHLHTIERSGIEEVDAVLDGFIAIAHRLPWRRTVGYLDVLDQEYLDNYGYVQLIGPDSIVEHQTVRVGIGLWGPNLHYPAHHHEAEELYHVLAGRPDFGDEIGQLRRTGPGDAVYHPPWQVHSQDFGKTPTVLLYCWAGAVLADAVLVETG